MTKESNKAAVSLISIIVPVYNGELHIGACLESIFSQEVDTPFEVIVVDDGSTDYTEKLTRHFPAHYFHIERSGVAAARNAGIKKTKGEIIFFFDADVKLKKDTLAKFLEHFRRDKDVYVMQGRWDKDSPFISFSSCFLLLKYIYGFKNLFKDGKRFKAANLETGCLAIRREVFDNVQVFDEGYKFSGGEEHELGMRLLEQYDIYYYDDIFVEHTFGRVLKTIGKIYRRTFNFSILAFGTKIKDFMKMHKNSAPVHDRVSVVIMFLLFVGLPIFIFDIKLGFLVCSVLFLLYILNISPFLSYLTAQKNIFFALKGIIADFVAIVPRMLGLISAFFVFYILRQRDSKI